MIVSRIRSGWKPQSWICFHYAWDEYKERLLHNYQNAEYVDATVLVLLATNIRNRPNHYHKPEKNNKQYTAWVDELQQCFPFECINSL